MFSPYKVGKCSFYFITGPFISTQIVLLIFIFSFALSSNWVESKTNEKVYYKYEYYSNSFDTDYYIDGESFKGGLNYCKSGCGYQNKDFYEYIRDIACDSVLIYPSNEIKTICNTFKDLTDFGWYKEYFDYYSLLVLIPWTLIISCPCHNWIYFKCSYLVSIGFAAVYLTGTLIWFTRAPISFGKCDSFPSDGDRLILCASLMSKLTMVLMLFIIFLFQLMLYLAVKLRSINCGYLEN